MKHKTEEFDVGVIVGRFQVPELHEAHRALIQAVCDAHDKVVIFLGLSPLMVTRENPLDFESRKQMLLEAFPKVSVLYIKDCVSDTAWSKRLDGMIADVTTPSQSVVLYGGRDSFISHYSGGFDTQELVSEQFFSGSSVRKEIGRRSAKSSADFRAGVVWAALAQFPTAYPTVDVAIFNESRSQILLGRKADETAYRLIGGFATPESESFEEDARREVREETGIEVSYPKYVKSFAVDDWRYRNERSAIKTLLFTATYVSGRPAPADDIVECRWFDWRSLWQSFHGRGMGDEVVRTHQPLIRELFLHVTPESA